MCSREEQKVIRKLGEEFIKGCKRERENRVKKIVGPNRLIQRGWWITQGKKT